MLRSFWLAEFGQSGAGGPVCCFPNEKDRKDRPVCFNFFDFAAKAIVVLTVRVAVSKDATYHNTMTAIAPTLSSTTSQMYVNAADPS